MGCRSSHNNTAPTGGAATSEAPEAKLPPFSPPMDGKKCEICCEREMRKGLWRDIRGFTDVDVRKMVREMAGLTLVDMGAGDGTVLGSVLVGIDVQFNHVVAVEPNADPEPAGDDADQVARIIPLRMKGSELPAKLAEHKLNDIGLFLCWPDPEYTYDLEAIRLLKPKKMVLLVGTYQLMDETNVLNSTLAGSSDLFNLFLRPLLGKAEACTFEGNRYRLERRQIKDDLHYFDNMHDDDEDVLLQPRNAKKMLLYIVQENEVNVK